MLLTLAQLENGYGFVVCLCFNFEIETIFKMGELNMTTALHIQLLCTVFVYALFFSLLLTHNDNTHATFRTLYGHMLLYSSSFHSIHRSHFTRLIRPAFGLLSSNYLCYINTVAAAAFSLSI